MSNTKTPRQPKALQEDLGTRFTRWIGSPASLGVHTLFFALSFVLGIVGVPWDRVLLVLTTILSLEAIYLSIFIQMTVNRNTQSLREVEENLDEIEEDIDEIAEDVDEIAEDVDEIQKDIDEIQEDVDGIAEDVDEITEEEKQEIVEERNEQETLEKIRADLTQLMINIEKLGHKH